MEAKQLDYNMRGGVEGRYLMIKYGMLACLWVSDVEESSDFNYMYRFMYFSELILELSDMKRVVFKSIPPKLMSPAPPSVIR